MKRKILRIAGRLTRHCSNKRTLAKLSATANPSLIYCAISPFGEEGPLRDAPGSELVVQAMAEYTASLGRIGDPPVRVGADIASLNTGIFAAQAVLAALFYRIRTGEGQRVAVSEFGSLLHMRGIMWSSLSDPDGVRLELIAEDLGSLYGMPLH